MFRMQARLAVGLWVWAATLVVVDTNQSLAQDIGVPDVETELPLAPIRFEVGLGHWFDTNIDRDGHFNVTGTRFKAGGTLPIGSDLGVDFPLTYELNSYDFSSSSPFQWDTIHTIQFAPHLRYAYDEAWMIFAGPVFRFSAEDGDDLGESFTGGAFGGFVYRQTEWLTMGFALGVLSQIEEDAAFVPIPILRWEFVDYWTLRTGMLELGQRNGLGMELAWEMVDGWELATGFQFQRQRFITDVADRIGENSSVPVYLKLTWEAWRDAQSHRAALLQMYTGLNVAGDLRLENDDGDRLVKQDYNPAFGLGVRLSLAF